jgi:peptidoglycan/LPS O-acetylase OafA/YrhL
MKTKNFFKRRIIRLHPMVILGVVLGVVSFFIQGSVRWDGSHVAVSMVMIAMLMNLFLIPAWPGCSADVRGNGEMYSLNGPNWSLFFEYIGNIIYAFFIRRLSTRWLTVLVVVLGISLTSFGVFNFSGFGHLGVGWTLADYNLPGGFLRMMFSYSMGLLLSRIFKPYAVRGAFWLCTVAIFLLLLVPHVGDSTSWWKNGLYDSFCIVVAFPILLYLGASGKTTDKHSSAICKFLGDISYPLYVVHYPSMYLFFAWVWGAKLTFLQVWPVAIALIIGNVILAYICLKLYDEPVRRWLANKFLKRKSNREV